jgi:hypothetical protein
MPPMQSAGKGNTKTRLERTTAVRPDANRLCAVRGSPDPARWPDRRSPSFGARRGRVKSSNRGLWLARETSVGQMAGLETRAERARLSPGSYSRPIPQGHRR